MTDVSSVYLLWHSYELEGCDEIKLLGVFSTLKVAREARARMLLQPGFRERKKGCEIVKTPVNRDLWAEGFVTMRSPDLTPPSHPLVAAGAGEHTVQTSESSCVPQPPE